jgi:ubiquinone/menaquinone biosynthesis C-methylase UbiE
LRVLPAFFPLSAIPASARIHDDGRIRKGLTPWVPAFAGMTMLLLSACKPSEKPPEFPAADRPVAPITASRFSTEEARDRVNESGTVMDAVGIVPGMTVADIGAGEGYYTIRLAQRVGEKGRVLAEDIMPEVRDALASRVTREAIDNVSVRLGEPADPKLPENSFDRVFMVHMYHEIGQPYEFLWRMRPSLRRGGRVVVVDSERPTQAHGTPIKLLQCEFAAVGYKLVENTPLPAVEGYIAQFEAQGPRPDPKTIATCEG